ncbi:MAG: hypothetical protein HDT39_02840 [Lachnospiraceae bacterium]|nr:hypothetical protein [Lachnospiraceae bacterium]
MKKKIIAAVILLIAIAVVGGFGYIKFKSSSNDKKPEKKFGFPLELMKTTNQSVKIRDCTITLTHYLYDEKIQTVALVFQVTGEGRRVEANLNHEGRLEYIFDNTLKPSFLYCKGEYKGDILYLYAIESPGSSVTKKRLEEEKPVFSIYDYESYDGIHDPTIDLNLELENTEKGFTITIPEGNTIYLSSVGCYIENLSVDGVEDMSLHFKDGKKQIFIKDKKIKAEQVNCISEQYYLDREELEFDIGSLLDMDNLEYVIVNGERYDVE